MLVHQLSFGSFWYSLSLFREIEREYEIQGDITGTNESLQARQLHNAMRGPAASLQVSPSCLNSSRIQWDSDVGPTCDWNQTQLSHAGLEGAAPK